MSHAAKIREIAECLLRLAEDEEQGVMLVGAGNSRAASADGADSNYLRRLAEALLRIRRLRNDHFDANLFADPAWDMLLDLFVQRSAKKRVAITSACIASHVPPTTALRWLALLEDRGLISREEDAKDRRRVYVSLTDQGQSAVERYLAAAGRHVRLTHPVPFMLVECQAL